MKNLNFEQMYAAIGKQDSTYEGIFFTAVKSTKIFCRPSCRARKPLAKNVVFYATAREALQAGYRPCKVCKPMHPEYETPDYIKTLIAELQKKPFRKISDWDLKQRGLEPHTLRRWFKRHHNMTFQGYQRLLRINSGFHQLGLGKGVLDTAYDSGYDSLSGFCESFKNVFGVSPSKSKHTNRIYVQRLTTKLGPMFFAATDEGTCMVEFADRRMLETEFRDLRGRLNAAFVPDSHEHILNANEQLKEYFQGERKNFDVPLITPGTEFQQQVWQQLLTIPYGETRSYAEQARSMGRPKAVRAVAHANGMNRIAIFIPCHRVIGSKGHLTGYGGGLPRKKFLLELESQQQP